jgi:hypothetical protein
MSSGKHFSWLHLTDLHYGQPGQRQLMASVRQKFFDDLLKLHKLSGPWDAVLFTGDLVYSGKEFSDMEDDFLIRLWKTLRELNSGDAVLLAVPGNHDLVRPKSSPPKPAVRVLLEEKGFQNIYSEFWSDPKCDYRKVCANCFSNYQTWWEKVPFRGETEIKYGMLPGDFTATLPISGHRIGIVGLNTTFLQLGDGDYKGRLAWDPQQLHEACGRDPEDWLADHDICLLLTHQGPDWLDKSSTELIPEIIPAGRFAVHLFGHMHEPQYISEAVGGGPVNQRWQGPSLFGMEKFGNPLQGERRHGYSSGKISFDEYSVRFWPRRAQLSGNGWNFFPDHMNFILDDNQCTKPQVIPLRNGTSRARISIKNQEEGSEDHIRHNTLADIYLDHVPAPIIAEIKDILAIDYIRTDCQYTFTFRQPYDWMPEGYFVLQRDLTFEVRNLTREDLYFPVRSAYSGDEDLTSKEWHGFKPHVFLSIDDHQIDLIEGKNLFWKNGVFYLERVVRLGPADSSKICLIGEEPCRVEADHIVYVQRSAAIGMSIKIKNEYRKVIDSVSVQMHHPGMFNEVKHEDDKYILNRAFLPGQGFQLQWKKKPRVS